jgi:hypothetical protein
MRLEKQAPHQVMSEIMGPTSAVREMVMTTVAIMQPYFCSYYQ